jgi:hypothetical protein
MDTTPKHISHLLAPVYLFSRPDLFMDNRKTGSAGTDWAENILFERLGLKKDVLSQHTPTYAISPVPEPTL